MQKTKVYAILAICVLLSISFIGGYVYAPTGTTYTISQGVYSGAPSFTLSLESGTYYVKNDMGAIDTQGTNATTVIQYALDNLPSAGGTVYLKQERYTLTGYLNISTSNTVLYGDGRATELYTTSSSLPYLINVEPTNNIQIKDLLIWASTSTNMDAIYFNNNAGIIWYPLIENVMTINIDIIGTDSDASGTNEVLQFPRFRNLIVENPNATAISLTSTIDGRIIDVIIFSSTQRQTTTGLYLNASLSSGYIIDRLTVVRQGYSAWLVQSDDTKISNSFLDLANNTYSLRINSSDNVIIQNTYLHAPYGTGLLIDGSTNSTVAIGVTSTTCATGISDASSPDGIQRFIGVLAHSSTTDWSIDANDVVRGSSNIADQG